MLLNEEQNLAVTTVDAPLLIIAGAGTGKTRVIIRKIEYLINDCKMSAGSILALTFTEKAQNEMQERLDEVLSINDGNVNVKTFHGFCDQTLREYGAFIGIDSSFQLMTQFDSWVHLRSKLYKLDLNLFRPNGNPSKFVSEILNFFDKLKDEDITEDNFLAYIEKLSDNTPEEKEYKERYHELAKAFVVYQKIKLEENLISFSDLQYYLHRLLEKSPLCLDKLRKRFKYILVDEFQDTNYAQNKLITLLAKDTNSLMVVGDDDQAIYKWRGASLTNIMGFEKNFPNYKSIVLTNNYRSAQNILDLSYFVIQNNNPLRLEVKEEVDKKLKANIGDLSGEIITSSFSSYLKEWESIYTKIIELKNKGESLSDMAILLRTNSCISQIGQYLQSKGVNVKMHSKINLLKNHAIKDLIGLLRFVASPRDDIALYQVLTNSFWEIEHEYLLHLVSASKSNNKSVFEYIKSKASASSQSLFEEENTKLSTVHEKLQKIIEFSKNKSVSEVLNFYMYEMEYLNFLLKDNANTGDIMAIAQFSEKIQMFEEKNMFTHVYHFLSNLKNIEDYMYLDDQDGDSIHEEGVHLMTIHASKGLEFNNVFVPVLVKNKFPTINRSESLEIPMELIEEDLIEEPHINEERRLFYVAVTRAKKNLYMSYSINYGSTRKWKPSPFVETSIASGLTKTMENNEEVIMLIKEKAKVEKKSIYKHNQKQISYSKLNSYNMCPLKYKYAYIYKIPTPQSFAASFGVSIHNTLNAFYNNMKITSDSSLETLLRLYEKHWVKYGYTSVTHHNNAYKRGKECLTNFHEENSIKWTVPAFLEKPFRTIIAGKIFTGRIDRIDQLEDGTYEIIDYKTGTFKEDMKLKNDLQLLIYLIVAKQQYQIEVSKLSLYYVLENKKATIDASDMNIEKAIEKIQMILENIDNNNFEPKPGMMCKYCDYRSICQAW